MLKIIQEDALRFKYAEEMSEQMEKETGRSSGSCSSMIWSGDADALERHGIKDMLGLMDGTLTEYFRDPNITNACKKRVWHCMKERIDDLYKRFFPGEDLLRDERRLQHEQG